MRTDNNQSSVLSCSFTWWSFLITGEVFQYKDFLVSSSIFGKKNTCCEVYFWWENTCCDVKQFLWKDFLKYEVFFWEKRFKSFLWLHFLWWEVSVLPLDPNLSNIWIKAFGKFQLEAPRAYKCKWILGLCHSPPQMKNQCGLWKKTSVR